MQADSAACSSCRPPAISGLTVPVQPDWTCGSCGRVWRDMRTSSGVQWWAEINGPSLSGPKIVDVEPGFFFGG